MMGVTYHDRDGYECYSASSIPAVSDEVIEQRIMEVVAGLRDGYSIGLTDLVRDITREHPEITPYRRRIEKVLLDLDTCGRVRVERNFSPSLHGGKRANRVYIWKGAAQ